jgi:NH3-dependent NAD+ synthetase
MKFSRDLIKLDCEKTVDDLAEGLKNQVYNDLKRQGAVVGTSGGIEACFCRIKTRLPIPRRWV